MFRLLGKKFQFYAENFCLTGPMTMSYICSVDCCSIQEQLFLLPGTRVGISGTTAKSRQRKSVPSSHPGPFALVASSHKSQTKVGTLACFDFL